MAQTYLARIESRNGHQIIVLPPEVHLEGEEVSILQDGPSGNITVLQTKALRTFKDLMDQLSSIEVSDEDLDDFMSERPMNRPITSRDVFEDE